MKPTCSLAVLVCVTLAPCFLCADVASASALMVCIDARRGEPPQDMTAYGVETRGFGLEAGFDGFPEAMSAAGILFVSAGQTVGTEQLLALQPNRDAICAFLSRGGVIWLGYDTWTGHEARRFLSSVNVGVPDVSRGGHRYWIPNPRSTSTFLTRPRPQTDEAGHTQIYMKAWPAGLEALLIEKSASDEASLLVANDVLGHGTIFFSTTAREWSTKRRGLEQLIANVLAHAFGALPAPGQTYAVDDVCRPRDPVANTAHLLRAGDAEWHVADAPRRKVLLVSEPIGMRRRAAYAEVAWRLPADLGDAPVRAFTGNGVELHAQRVAASRFALSVPLRPYDDALVYLYAGSSSDPAVHDRRRLAARRTEEGWVLESDCLAAVLAPRTPRLQLIRPHGDTRNTLMTWGNSERWLGHGTSFVKQSAEQPPSSKAKLVAAGPVIHTIRYTVRDSAGARIIDVCLVRGASALYFAGRAAKVHALRTETGWCPGDAFSSDSLWYEAAEGMKRLTLIPKPASRYRLGAHATASWYAIADGRTGEAGGGFCDAGADAVLPVSFYSHMVHGQLITQSFQFTPAGVRGGWVASMGGAAAVRRAYLDWRNPPVVTDGPEQTRDARARPGIPVFGRDFLRIHGGFRRYKPVNARDGLDDWAESAIAAVREAAGNVVSMGDHLIPEHFPALMAAAHRHGLPVCLKVNTRRLGCSVTNREAYLERTREMAPYRADLYYLLDEFRHGWYNEVCAADFNRKTGLVMPPRIDLALLPDEPTYQTILWRMDVVTDLVRQMDAIVKAERPDAVTFVVSNTAALGWELPGLNDLAKWSDVIGTTSSDLYADRFALTRFGTRFVRGAQGNDKPVLMVHGNDLTSAEGNYNNLGQHLLSGANALWFFSIGHYRFGRDVVEPVIREYETLRDTGLGDVLAVARPVRYAAVLFERGSFFDGVRRGDFIGLRPVYHDRVEKQSALRNVPVDIVYSKHLARELPRYRVLIVPGGRDASEATVSTVTAWVRGGGRVIVEGEALLTPALAALCGVSAEDGRDGAVAMVAQGARILRDDGGRPVVTRNAVGKGIAAAIAHKDVSHDLLRPLVTALAGDLPVDIDPASAPHVRVSASSDGERCAIGLYNEELAAKRVTVDLGSLPPRGDRIVTNVHRGTREPVTDSVTVDLPGGAWLFLLLEPVDRAPPLAEPGAPVSADVYATNRATATPP